MPTTKHSSPAGLRVLKKIRALAPFIQASFTVTHKRCGNPNCRCATEGPIHEAALLTWKEDAKTKTVSVPLELRDEVQAWVDEGKRLKRLIAQMSREQVRWLVRLKEQVR